MKKFCTEALKKVFSNAKNDFKKDIPALLPRKFFHVRFHVFLVQFEINLHL